MEVESRVVVFGRIQIVKTFAIPKLMFRASAIPISKELLKSEVSEAILNMNKRII